MTKRAFLIKEQLTAASFFMEEIRMIINKKGDIFEWQGKKYIIGDDVIATNNSDYSGLLGTICEIRTENDKDTENSGPDIYCRFNTPVLKQDIKVIEDRFSKVSGVKRKIDEIALDEVIMTPNMLKVANKCNRDEYKIPVYAVYEDWSDDGNTGNSYELYTDYDMAKLNFNKALNNEIQNGIIGNIKNDTSFIVEEGKDMYDGYIDGEYLWDHYMIEIRKEYIDTCVSMEKVK